MEKMNTSQPGAKRDALIIVNAEDRALCWSNEAGWVTEGWDTFSEAERARLRLPLGGEWLESP